MQWILSSNAAGTNPGVSEVDFLAPVTVANAGASETIRDVNGTRKIRNSNVSSRTATLW
jgi:hypothetical protein